MTDRETILIRIRQNETLIASAESNLSKESCTGFDRGWEKCYISRLKSENTFLSSLINAPSSEDDEEDRLCPECGGEGIIPCEYEGEDNDAHEDCEECPKCGGECYI